MACNGDGVEVDIIDVESIPCAGCDSCRPREVHDDGGAGAVSGAE